jgi:hypothetical protein
MPNRPLSLLGAARAYNHAGKGAQAAQKYQAFLSFWKDDSHDAATQAKAFMAHY